MCKAVAPDVTALNAPAGNGVPDGEGVDFSLSIDNCRKPPELEGMVLRGEMCNFEMLLGLVHD